MITQRLSGIVEFLEKVGPLLPTTAVGEGGGSDSVIEYTPTEIPVEGLLAPISAENPVGEDPQLSGDINQLLSLITNKLRIADFTPAYDLAEKKAVEILSSRGKHLGVVVRLMEATTERCGFTAIADVENGVYPDSGATIPAPDQPVGIPG